MPFVVLLTDALLRVCFCLQLNGDDATSHAAADADTGQEDNEQHPVHCQKCKKQLSAYFCPKCKHFTSIDKNPYHCKKCGICR